MPIDTGHVRDFPYYAGDPVAISPAGWAILMVSIAVAFVALLCTPVQTLPASLVPAVVFAAIPLGTLAVLTGRHWQSLFRFVDPRAFGMMMLAAAGAMAASAAMALVIRTFSVPVANPVVSAMAKMSSGDYIRRLIPTAPQLLGEELLTILPFLAILWFATQRLGIARTPAILMALAGSTILFSAAHLPTYRWQVAQCFGVIGAARMVLTLSYIWSRNLWVPVGAHILNDWTEFTMVFGLGHLPIGTE